VPVGSPESFNVANAGIAAVVPDRPAQAEFTSLTARVRALYENSVVPVREIARLAGVTERTLYKYAERGEWRQRYVRGARADAVAADRARLIENARQEQVCPLPNPRLSPSARPGAGPRPQAGEGSEHMFAPVRGAGGRYVRRAEAGLAHARGLKALDPAGAQLATQACAAAALKSDAAVEVARRAALARAAREQAERDAASAVRAMAMLSGAVVELAKVAGGGTRRAEALAARLGRAIAMQMERVVAG
jgi:hypothetical protein